MPLVVGVDSSTQSTKVVLHDLDSGAVVAAGSAPHPPISPPISEQDPGAWWTALTLALDRAVAAAAVSRRDIAAISVAAQCHGLVALDGDGAVIRPAKLWNDTTSSDQMRQLLDAVPPASWVRRTGSVPTAAFTVSKLLALKQTEPHHFARLATVLLPHDWLTFRLTGARITDRSEASGTGYFDASTETYDLDLLRLVDAHTDWAPMLPRVLAPEESAGRLSTAAARELGLRSDVVVGAGAGDQHVSALALGVHPGDLAYVFGTSGVVFTVSREPVFDPSGIVDGVADAAGGYLPLVSTLNAARVTDGVARLLAVDHDALAALALAAPAEGTPAFAAYLDGERKPDLPAATGTISGLTAATSREQLARAAFEGVIFGLVRGTHALTAVGAPTGGRTIISGGGARSAAYRQLLADATGSVVHLAVADEAVAGGAAIQAAACLTGRPIAEVRDAWVPPPIPVVGPRAGSSATGAYERYLATAAWRGGDR